MVQTARLILLVVMTCLQNSRLVFLLTDSVQFLLEFLTAHHFHAALPDGLLDRPCARHIVVALKALELTLGELIHFRPGESAKVELLPQDSVDLVFGLTAFAVWRSCLHEGLGVAPRVLGLTLGLIQMTMGRQHCLQWDPRRNPERCRQPECLLPGRSAFFRMKDGRTHGGLPGHAPRNTRPDVVRASGMPRIVAVKGREDTVARTHGPAVRPTGGDGPRRRAERKPHIFERALAVDAPSRGKAKMPGPGLHPCWLLHGDPAAASALAVPQAQAPGRDERGAGIEHGAGPGP